MRQTTFLAALVILSPLLGAAPLAAQGQDQPGARDQQQQQQQQRRPDAARSADQVAPGPGPQDRGRMDATEIRARLLADLFEKLKAAPNAQEAQTLHEGVVAIWTRSGSVTLDLFMVWSQEDLVQRNVGGARDLLDGIIALNPDFAEAYHRRAQLHFAERDYAKAMADLERTLALEPRHYVALTGVGAILRDLDKPREALAAFRAALAIHPFFEPARRSAELLRPRVDGRDG